MGKGEGRYKREYRLPLGGPVYLERKHKKGGGTSPSTEGVSAESLQVQWKPVAERRERVERLVVAGRESACTPGVLETRGVALSHWHFRKTFWDRCGPRLWGTVQGQGSDGAEKEPGGN